MKNALIFAALALASLNAMAAATPGQTMTDFHAALASGDKKTVTSLLSPEVVIFESGYVERSRDEYAKHHLDSDIEFSKATKRKVTQHSEHVEGNTATVLQETTTSGTFKGRSADAIGLETAILERDGGNWVIVHLHWSSRKPK
jgi:ketosteroid isomerase-like protein